MNRRRALQLSLGMPFLGASALAAPKKWTSSRSKKKGLCITTREGTRWADKVRAVEAHWMYSWGPTAPKNLPAGVEFIPMIWGYWGQDEQIAKAGKAAKASGGTHLLGFNEPDQKSQSNMSVDKALRAWPKLMETGLRLGGPGCVHPDNEWMKEFMKKADERKLRVDFVCVHSYGGTNMDHFVKRMERVHRMFKRPLWITEFAVGDWNAKSRAQNQYKPAQIARYMEKLLPKLESMDIIERYSWFPTGPDNRHLGPSALFKKDGSLTELGRIYRDV